MNDKFKGTSHSLIVVLPRHLPLRTVETTRNLILYGWRLPISDITITSKSSVLLVQTKAFYPTYSFIRLTPTLLMWLRAYFTEIFWL